MLKERIHEESHKRQSAVQAGLKVARSPTLTRPNSCPPQALRARVGMPPPVGWQPPDDPSNTSGYTPIYPNPGSVENHASSDAVPRCGVGAEPGGDNAVRAFAEVVGR